MKGSLPEKRKRAKDRLDAVDAKMDAAVFELLENPAYFLERLKIHVYHAGVTDRERTLRQDLLAALGEPLEVDNRSLHGTMVPESELSWRRGWNAKRESMLEAINRLLPEEG